MNECRHAPKRHTTTVCSAPAPALDLGSSLLTLAVAVTLALVTSSPRPERTSPDMPPLAALCSQGLQSISHRLVVFQQDGYITLTQYVCSLRLTNVNWPSIGLTSRRYRN